MFSDPERRHETEITIQGLKQVFMHFLQCAQSGSHVISLTKKYVDCVDCVLCVCVCLLFLNDIVCRFGERGWGIRWGGTKHKKQANKMGMAVVNFHHAYS